MPEALRDAKSVQLSDWPTTGPRAGIRPQLAAAYTTVLEVREAVTKALEEARNAKVIGKSQEAAVSVTAPADVVAALDARGAVALAELFIVASVETRAGDEVAVSITAATGEKCPRCWNLRELGTNADHPRCARDARACWQVCIGSGPSRNRRVHRGFEPVVHSTDEALVPGIRAGHVHRRMESQWLMTTPARRCALNLRRNCCGSRPTSPNSTGTSASPSRTRAARMVYRDHMADQGTATFERELDMTFEENERDLLDAVRAALARMDAGTYGTCERCGVEIPAGRLEAVPTASLCITCKESEETR